MLVEWGLISNWWFTFGFAPASFFSPCCLLHFYDVDKSFTLLFVGVLIYHSVNDKSKSSVFILGWWHCGVLSTAKYCVVIKIILAAYRCVKLPKPMPIHDLEKQCKNQQRVDSNCEVHIHPAKDSPGVIVWFSVHCLFLKFYKIY